jgi:CHAD domain-containing protein
MANGKWISELNASMPLADAARRGLNVRLQVVHHYLPLALEHWTEDAEHIHQLRVGTRRAGAALSIFRCCLPGKLHKNLRKHLRKLRRAAGAARDWDVFSESLRLRESQAAAAQRCGLDFLIGYSMGQRTTAQEALAAASPKAPRDFESVVVEALANLRQPSADSAARRFGDMARPRLACLLQQLESAAAGNLEEYEHLHQVRICGKHLRYCMEIFASCFEESFKERYYPMVEEMQDILGHANDSHVASQRLAALRGWLKKGQPTLWQRLKAGIEGLLRCHQRRLPQERRKFMRWWECWQKSGAGAALADMVSIKE